MFRIPYPEIIASGLIAVLIVVADHLFPVYITAQSRGDLSQLSNLIPMAIQGMGLSAGMGAILWPVKQYGPRLGWFACVMVAYATVSFFAPHTNILYLFIRFGIPAITWCGLYWKRGLNSTIYSHAAVYLVFGLPLVFLEGIH